MTYKPCRFKIARLFSFPCISDELCQFRRFYVLLDETKKVKTALSTVKYCVIIKDSTVKVRKYESETDYSYEVEETFKKFKQGAVKDYRVKLL